MFSGNFAETLPIDNELASYIQSFSRKNGQTRLKALISLETAVDVESDKTDEAILQAFDTFALSLNKQIITEPKASLRCQSHRVIQAFFRRLQRKIKPYVKKLVPILLVSAQINETDEANKMTFRQLLPSSAKQQAAIKSCLPEIVGFIENTWHSSWTDEDERMRVMVAVFRTLRLVMQICGPLPEFLDPLLQTCTREGGDLQCQALRSLLQYESSDLQGLASLFQHVLPADVPLILPEATTLFGRIQHSDYDENVVTPLLNWITGGSLPHHVNLVESLVIQTSHRSLVHQAYLTALSKSFIGVDYFHSFLRILKTSPLEDPGMVLQVCVLFTSKKHFHECQSVMAAFMEDHLSLIPREIPQFLEKVTPNTLIFWKLLIEKEVLSVSQIWEACLNRGVDQEIMVGLLDMGLPEDHRLQVLNYFLHEEWDLHPALLTPECTDRLVEAFWEHPEKLSMLAGCFQESSLFRDLILVKLDEGCWKEVVPLLASPLGRQARGNPQIFLDHLRPHLEDHLEAGLKILVDLQQVPENASLILGAVLRQPHVSVQVGRILGEAPNLDLDWWPPLKEFLVAEGCRHSFKNTQSLAEYLDWDTPMVSVQTSAREFFVYQELASFKGLNTPLHPDYPLRHHYRPLTADNLPTNETDHIFPPFSAGRLEAAVQKKEEETLQLWIQNAESLPVRPELLSAISDLIKCTALSENLRLSVFELSIALKMDLGAKMRPHISTFENPLLGLEALVLFLKLGDPPVPDLLPEFGRLFFEIEKYSYLAPLIQSKILPWIQPILEDPSCDLFFLSRSPLLTGLCVAASTSRGLPAFRGEFTYQEVKLGQCLQGILKLKSTPRIAAVYWFYQCTLANLMGPSVCELIFQEFPASFQRLAHGQREDPRRIQRILQGFHFMLEVGAHPLWLIFTQSLAGFSADTFKNLVKPLEGSDLRVFRQFDGFIPFLSERKAFTILEYFFGYLLLVYTNQQEEEQINLLSQCLIQFPADFVSFLQGLSENRQETVDLLETRVAPLFIDHQIQELQAFCAVSGSGRGFHLQMEAGELWIRVHLIFPIEYPILPCDLEVSETYGFPKMEATNLMFNALMQVRRDPGVLKKVLLGIKDALESKAAKYDDCPICFGTVAQGALPSQKCGTCSRMFHKSCINSWFSKREMPTCPLCQSAWTTSKRKS